MISQIESGLTAEQYDIIAAGGRPYAYGITAHQYNPDFVAVAPSSTAPTNDTDEFAVLRAGNFIFRLTVNVLERMDTGLTNPVWTTLTFPMPVNPLATPAAMTFVGSTISVYMCTMTGVQVSTSTNNGATWSAWSAFSLGTTGTQSQYSYTADMATDTTKASASSVLEGIYVAARGFDNADTIWCSSAPPTVGSTQWLRYDFTIDRAITKYTIKGRPAANFGQNPKTWTLESSPNGTTWTVRETRTNITNWSPLETKTFVVKTLTDVGAWAAARYWRINITAGQDPAAVGVAIQEMEMMETVFTTVPEVIRIHAPVAERIHFVLKDANRSLYNLRVARLVDAIWEFTTSDIYWTFDILSFNTVAATDDVDAIALVTEVPGTLSILNENNSPAKYIFTSGGVIVLTYRYGTWSDHVEVDVVDDMQDFRYRRAARIAKLNGRLYITAYSSDGTEDFPVTGYRCYSANTDATFWSNGNVMSLSDSAGESGAVMLSIGNYIYAIEAKASHRAYSTFYFGRSVPETMVTLTDFIVGNEFSQEAVFQSGILLANPLQVGSTALGVWNNHPILNKDTTVWLTHRMGYWVPSGSTWVRVMVQIAVTQVESYEFGRTEGERTLRITCRDTLSRATDYVKSEQARYWKSQVLGADDYTDNAGSNYGGLSHTATETGSHQTRNRYLELNSANAECISFSTFASNLWNGTQQTGFFLKVAGTAQYAGVVFRAIDGLNFWYAYYNQATDKIILARRVNGNEVVLLDNFQSASTMGWTNLAIGRYIRVEFRYGMIKVFTSTDSAAEVLDGGKVWTKRIEHLVNCLERTSGGAYLKRLEEAMAERGYVGSIGKGPL